VPGGGPRDKPVSQVSVHTCADAPSIFTISDVVLTQPNTSQYNMCGPKITLVFLNVIKITFILNCKKIGFACFFVVVVLD